MTKKIILGILCVILIILGVISLKNIDKDNKNVIINNNIGNVLPKNEKKDTIIKQQENGSGENGVNTQSGAGAR